MKGALRVAGPLPPKAHLPPSLGRISSPASFPPPAPAPSLLPPPAVPAVLPTPLRGRLAAGAAPGGIESAFSERRLRFPSLFGASCSCAAQRRDFPPVPGRQWDNLENFSGADCGDAGHRWKRI